MPKGETCLPRRAISPSSVSAKEACHRRHDPSEVEAIGPHQEAARRRGEFEDDEPAARAEYAEHLTQRGIAIDEVAQPEPDRDGIDTGVGLVQPSNVSEAKLDL